MWKWLNWKFWLILLLLVIFILWLFKGGGNYQFIGLNPPSIDNANYICSIPRVNHYPMSHASQPNYATQLTYPTNDAIQPVCNLEHPRIDETPTLPVELLKSNQPVKPKPKRKSRGEMLCCRIMEEIFHKPFKSIRPDFLTNPETGRNLEIDCYNDELKIGVEYSGIQHYVWPNYTGQSYEEFIQQVRRDQYKVEACDRAGVYLITVPYNVPENLIRPYIEYYLPQQVAKRMTDELQRKTHIQVVNP